MARPFFRRRKSCPFSAKDAPRHLLLVLMMTLAEGEMRGCLGEKRSARRERERETPRGTPPVHTRGTTHCLDDSDRQGILSRRARALALVNSHVSMTMMKLTASREV